ncbi:MAG: HAD-IA family hydrolase [Anaeromyxobacteraceae bacterium]
MPPALLTFDVFGTVLDWRRGLLTSAAAHGRTLAEAEFDGVVDRQAELERASPFRTYAEITAQSLVEVVGLPPGAADAIGREVGRWPLHPDSGAALARLMRVAPCVAMTNSDRAHGADVRAALGRDLSAWFCAEDVRCYKPDPAFWREVSTRLGVPLDRAWWHVSAYADYDLDVARSLGLTTVLVERPHARPGSADHRVPDLAALAVLLGA